MIKFIGRSATLSAVSTVCMLLLAGASASAMSLKEAVSEALVTNPKIGQAIQNHQAMNAQLDQARSLYMPRVDLEGALGVQQYDRHDASLIGGSLNQNLSPAEIGVVVTQKIFDGFATQAENERQTARVAGGESRVWERSESVALSIAREYIQVILQQRVMAIAEDNVAFHKKTLSEIESAVSSGTLTDADKFQAQERLAAASAKVKVAQEELNAAKIRFSTLVGKPLGAVGALPSVRSLPGSMESAITRAQINNPTVAVAWADINAADALVKAARAKYMPELFLEGRARAGHDIDVNPGRTTDLQARLVMRWNIFDGGGSSAAEREQIHLTAQERLKLDEFRRDITEQVKLAWDKRVQETALTKIYNQQLAEGIKVVNSYLDQFKVGRRSLLDVLDAQNTRFNTAVVAETAKLSAVFADYQLLAADGDLLKTLNVKPPVYANTAVFRDAENAQPSPVK